MIHMITVKCCGCNEWYRAVNDISMAKIEVFSSGVIVEQKVHISNCPFCETETETATILEKEAMAA